MGKQAAYTFKYSCDTCDQKPVLKDTGMCSVCTFGEADSMWEWLDDNVVNVERKATQQFIDQQLVEMAKADMFNTKTGEFDPIAASVMHLDQHVLDRIEAVI